MRLHVEPTCFGIHITTVLCNQQIIAQSLRMTWNYVDVSTVDVTGTICKVCRMVCLRDFNWLIGVNVNHCPYFQGHVVMGNNAISPYQQVIEKTKSLSFRSQMLAMNIEKKAAHNSRNEVSPYTYCKYKMHIRRRSQLVIPPLPIR